MDTLSSSSVVKSLMCRKAARPPRAMLLIAFVSAASVLPTAASLAAQTYVEPKLDLRIEYNDNFDLRPGSSPDSDVYGFVADAQALIGIATPRSDTSLRPRLRLQKFPDRDDLQRVEAFFDLRSQYQWQRSNFLLIGRYSRQDIYNTDTPSGAFDPLDPDYSGTPDSAQIVLGETRTRFQLRPTFEYKVTERASIGIAADYQIARYDADGVPRYTDYDYAALNGFVTWALSTTSDFTVGAYASRYETQDNNVDADALGGRLGYAHRWSETSGMEATVFYEQNDITHFVPVRSEESTSGLGGDLTAYRKHEVSAWRLTVGRTFIPTGDRGKSQSDQIRLQYDRDLSDRLSLRAVARYDSYNSLAETGGSEDRDYARMDVSLKWFVTETWYLGGGYSYIWVDRAQAPGDASNNKVFVNFGYQGLPRQRR